MNISERFCFHGFLLLFMKFSRSLRFQCFNSIIIDRPKSAMLQAIQDKVFSLMAPQYEEETTDDDDAEEEDDDGEMETDIIAHQGEDINIDEDKVNQ